MSTITIQEKGFQPATLGGLWVYVKNDKGLFSVFNITEDLTEIIFDFSPTGLEEDLIRSSDIDGVDDSIGFYAERKAELIRILRERKFDVKALGLFYSYYRQNFNSYYEPKHLPSKIDIISIKPTGFSLTAIGGLAVQVQTDKGFFELMGVLSDSKDIFFNYSSDGEYYTHGFELDGFDSENRLDQHNGIYKEYLDHLVEIAKQEYLFVEANRLFSITRSINKALLKRMKADRTEENLKEVAAILEFDSSFSKLMDIPKELERLFE